MILYIDKKSSLFHRKSVSLTLCEIWIRKRKENNNSKTNKETNKKKNRILLSILQIRATSHADFLGTSVSLFEWAHLHGCQGQAKTWRKMCESRYMMINRKWCSASKNKVFFLLLACFTLYHLSYILVIVVSKLMTSYYKSSQFTTKTYNSQDPAKD